MLDKDSLGNEISVGVTFASLMAAISLFFTGVLVSEYDSLEATIKVPMLLLIISTFSFIFAATIYSNAGSEITLGKVKRVEKYMVYATNIVEFLGLYPLIISMPLVIGAVTDDNFLRISTTIVAVCGMVLYSQSRFSILEKQLPNYQKRLYSFAIAWLALMLYAAQLIQQSGGIGYYTFFAVLLLVVLLAPVVFFSTSSKQYRYIRVRPYKDIDAPALSEIAQRSLQAFQRGKPTKRPHELLKAETSVKAIQAKAKTETLLVALVGSTRVGYICVDGKNVATIITDPRVQRKGVGRMLIEAAEVAVAADGHEEIDAHTHSSLEKFYHKLGFVTIDKPAKDEVKVRKEL